MILTIDIGNTTTAIALFSGQRIVFRNRVTTPAACDSVFLKGLLKKTDIRPIRRTIVSSVVPRLDSQMKKAIRGLLGHYPGFVSHGLDLGFQLAIDHPRELGADRICACAGALSLCRPPLLVIDSGTATTFDLVNAKREYIGGCILPGLEISLQALATRTAKLKRIAFRIPKSACGKNTADQIRSGIYFGFLGTLIVLIEEYRKILGRKTTVFSTGGLSRLYHERVEGIDVFEPDLVFLGLHALAARNP